MGGRLGSLCRMKPGFGPKYLEDLAVGDRNQTASIDVTESDSIAFAERYDPQPMHTDPEAAARGSLGISVHGLRVVALGECDRIGFRHVDGRRLVAVAHRQVLEVFRTKPWFHTTKAAEAPTHSRSRL